MMRRIATLLSVVAVATGTLALGWGSSVGAVPPPGTTFSSPGGNGTAANQFTVPPGVCQVSVDARGAEGGAGVGTNSQGALGGQALATFAVTPGETLNVFVGGKGGNANLTTGGAGGANGGGDGGDSQPTAGSGQAAGGGGGASDVRQGGSGLGNRVVVAGGGGGGGGASSNATQGGAGGGTTGSPGSAAAGQANPGQAGTQSAGGAGGVGVPSPARDGQTGSAGDGGDGADGIGGGGGSGGGGGGGYYGGGGAGTKDFYSGAGGGGGSGFTPTGTGMSNGVLAYNSGNGRVTITAAEPGVGCPIPSILRIRKEVFGTVDPGGFVVSVVCSSEGGGTLVDVLLHFTQSGAPDPTYPPGGGWAIVDGAWQLEDTDLAGDTCTATETVSQGAPFVAYLCGWTPPELDGYIGQIEFGCPGLASGWQQNSATVLFEGNGDVGVLTTGNAYFSSGGGTVTTTTTTTTTTTSPSTTTTTSPSTTTTTSPSTTTTTAPTAAAAAAALAFTGSDAKPVLIAGIATIAVGALLLVSARRRGSSATKS